MTILYLTSSGEDYLQDQILLGLREVLADQVLDHPRKSVLYQNCKVPAQKLYGRGFTIWKFLRDIQVNRNDVDQRIKAGEFNTLIFGNIWRQRNEFQRFRSKRYLRHHFHQVAFLDGEDHNHTYLPALPYGLYFKREFGKIIRFPRCRRINFSIPEVKIRPQPIQKDQLFAKHCQCEEAYKLAQIQEHCQRSYLFEEEDHYYLDLARSHYAVTMKKQGWECMRHYEIAANHTVPCFYQLDHKPRWSAPHGLVDRRNVLSFNSANELKDKINEVRRSELYPELQQQAFQWAAKNSCRQVATNFLNQLSSNE